ncbi:MAG: amidohydrolase family protein, partial [Acidimicrobiia bacterium]
MELMTSMSCAADRPINWNVLGLSAANRDHALRQLRASDHAAARGGRVVALTLPHGPRIRLSFLGGAPLDGLPGWREVLSLPVPERVRALSDPAVRARLARGATSDEAGVLRGLANWPIMQIVEAFTPETRAFVGHSIADIAEQQAKDPFDALLDIAVADELRTGFRPPQAPETPDDWAFRTEMWRDPRVIIGGSDAGAHLDMMCGAVYSTSVLAGVRRGGLLALEEAVRLLSDVPARLYGLRDRGRIALGHHADLVVFDAETVDYGTESTTFDLPGGAWRLTTDSVGVERVYVNGTAVVSAGEFTGATPGGLLRSGRDTRTVRASSAPRSVPGTVA